MYTKYKDSSIPLNEHNSVFESFYEHIKILGVF